MKYPTLWARLMANSVEPENGQGCWLGVKEKPDAGGYHRFNLYVPGLLGTRRLMAHIVAWLLTEIELRTPDEVYLAYQELTASGLELDHLCRRPDCRNPDHLELVTASENCQRRCYERRPLPAR